MPRQEFDLERNINLLLGAIVERGVRDYQNAVMYNRTDEEDTVRKELILLGFGKYTERARIGAEKFRAYVLENGNDLKPGERREWIACPNCKEKNTVSIKRRPKLLTGICISCGLRYYVERKGITK